MSNLDGEKIEEEESVDGVPLHNEDGVVPTHNGTSKRLTWDVRNQIEGVVPFFENDAEANGTAKSVEEKSLAVLDPSTLESDSVVYVETANSHYGFTIVRKGNGEFTAIAEVWRVSKSTKQRKDLGLVRMQPVIVGKIGCQFFCVSDLDNADEGGDIRTTSSVVKISVE